MGQVFSDHTDAVDAYDVHEASSSSSPRTLALTHEPPKSARVVDVFDAIANEGSMCGRVSFVVAKTHAPNANFDGVPTATSLTAALANAAGRIGARPGARNAQVVCVAPSAVAVKQCISSGRLVCCALPVTSDFVDGIFARPATRSTPFATVPVYIWAYEDDVFYVDVLHPAFASKRTAALRGTHVFDRRARDFTTIIVPSVEDEVPLFVEASRALLSDHAARSALIS